MQLERDLINRILNTIKRFEMIKPHDKVMVAVSGGPDSVFLLYVLDSLKDILNIKLYVAHLDHGIRGRESENDALFVKRLANHLGLDSVIKKNREKIKGKISLEEFLREKRYKFFKEACKKTGSSIVATAHTLDDQAETVLMRILQGTTSKGLIGIHPIRYEGNIAFIRPIIELQKRDVLRYLKDKRIGYRIDRTNSDNSYFRNKIRNNILPYLEKINPQIKRSLFFMAESLREDYAFLEEEKKKRRCLIRRGKDVSIRLSDMLMQPKAIQRELARDLMISLGANVKKLTYRHWKAMDEIISRHSANKSISLPGGVMMRKTRDKLVFLKNNVAI